VAEKPDHDRTGAFVTGAWAVMAAPKPSCCIFLIGLVIRLHEGLPAGGKLRALACPKAGSQHPRVFLTAYPPLMTPIISEPYGILFLRTVNLPAL